MTSGWEREDEVTGSIDHQLHPTQLQLAEGLCLGVRKCFPGAESAVPLVSPELCVVIEGAILPLRFQRQLPGFEVEMTSSKSSSTQFN